MARPSPSHARIGARSAAVVLPVLLALVLSTAACTSSTGRSNATRDTPGTASTDQLHLTWRHDPHTSVVVQWHTARPERSTVLVRRKGDGGWRTATGRTAALHAVELTHLHAATTYEYAVRTATGWSAAQAFTTAPPDDGTSMRFDVFADQGDCRTFAAACRVIDGIASDRPAFVVAAGDLSYGTENGLAADDRWLNDIKPWAASAPVMPSWGNHETEYPNKDPLSRFKARFALPGNEDWYSFDAGPVHFVTLPERYVPVSPGTPYHRFLTSDLAAARADTRIRWIVAFGHRPVYSTGTKHGPELRFQRSLVPLFDRLHVNLVLTGHEHTYERTQPMEAGSAGAGGRGTTYIVTGGGGAAIYDDFGPLQPWDAVRAVTHEHLRVDATQSSLHVVAIADDGRTVDDFTLAHS